MKELNVFYTNFGLACVHVWCEKEMLYFQKLGGNLRRIGSSVPEIEDYRSASLRISTTTSVEKKI